MFFEILECSGFLRECLLRTLPGIGAVCRFGLSARVKLLLGQFDRGTAAFRDFDILNVRPGIDSRRWPFDGKTCVFCGEPIG